MSKSEHPERDEEQRQEQEVPAAQDIDNEGYRDGCSYDAHDFCNEMRSPGVTA
jgi:hypothetical protein